MCTAAGAGILVSRTEQGLQFTDAVAVTFNAKDKALSLGGQAKLSGPLSKLPTTRVEGVLLKDSDTGVLARFEEGKAEYLVPQGLPKTAPDNPAAIWKTAKITYKKSAQDKAGSDIAAAAFVAFLPGGAEELTRLCMDDAALAIDRRQGQELSRRRSNSCPRWLRRTVPIPRWRPSANSWKTRCAAGMTGLKVARAAWMSLPRV